MAKLSTDRDKLNKGSFAFIEQRKDPLATAAHVRNAIARFSQVKNVSDGDRDEAWQRIVAVGNKHGVDIEEKSWREIGKD